MTAVNATPAHIFIDASLPDLATLRAGLPTVAIAHLLDPKQDGLQQIAAALAGQSDIATLHLISHGAAGRLYLGNGSVSQQDLPYYRDALDSIANAMAEDGEWLIYSCEVAAGREGQLFVKALREMTGLKVAAATHKVGAAELGGSWVLDDVPVMANRHSLQAKTLAVPQWQGVLAAPVIGGIDTDDNSSFDIGSFI